jgi:Holliday junction resolvase-like predicted endonuclease
MINIGEELVAAYLEYIKGCEFVQKNLYTPDTQGEIDVVAINLKQKSVYICEVAIHLTTGLRYVKDRQPNNVNKLTDKFSKDIDYANKYFEGYEKYFMLWTPIIKNSRESSKHNQFRDLEEINKNIRQKYGVEIDFITNDRFLDCLTEMRKYVSNETKDIKSPVLRLMQIEEYLKSHVGNTA